MAKVNRNTLKSYFNTGDRPTEAQFVNLIDSSVNHIDDNYIDSSNTNNSPNLVEWKEEWREGLRTTNFFRANGNFGENIIIKGENPFGSDSLIWKCQNDIDNDNTRGDGGWNTDYFKIEQDKSYRFTVWVKKNIRGGNSTFFGTKNVRNLNGSVNDNPYFWSGDLPTEDEWYLLVGIVHSHNYTSLTSTQISGVYDKYGGKVFEGVDYKWRTDRDTSMFRCYLNFTYNETEQYFWNPTVNIMDGTETSLDSYFEDGFDTDWKMLSLTNGITNFGEPYPTARYRRVKKIVYIDGLIKGGVNGDDITIATLPEGFRPQKRPVLVSWRANGAGRVDIDPSGDIRCYNFATGWTSISGLQFFID